MGMLLRYRPTVEESNTPKTVVEPKAVESEKKEKKSKNK